MKHFYIINPKAGKGNHTDILCEQIKKAYENSDIDIEIYITKCRNDAREYTENLCKIESDPFNVYACGGDGTLCEVAAGAALGNKISVGVVPCGSGNDYIKNFSDEKAFSSITAQKDAVAKTVDIIKFGNNYSLNMTSFGFDAKVAKNLKKFKKWPVSGKMAYNLSVAYTLFGKLWRNIEIILDSGEVLNRKAMIAVVASGKCYGNGFYAAPYAKVDDGLIDFVVMDKVSRPKFVKLVKIFKKGEHIEHPQLKDITVYRQCKKITVIGEKQLPLNIDGEVSNGNNITFEILPGAIDFLVPKNQ